MVKVIKNRKHFHDDVVRMLSHLDHNFEKPRLHDITKIGEQVQIQIQELLEPEIYEYFDLQINYECNIGREQNHVYNIAGGFVNLGFVGSGIIDIVFQVTDQQVYVDGEIWEDIKYEIGQVIDHEMIHYYQAQHRSCHRAKIIKLGSHDKDYYGCSDELEAFAYNAANDLLRETLGSKKGALYLLRQQPDKIWYKRSRCTYLNRYNELFGSEHPKIYNRFKKKISQYIERLA